MRTPRIYTPQPLEEHSSIELVASAAHYIANVLRMKPGRELILFNGKGGEYHGSLDRVSKKSVTVVIGAFADHHPESPVAIELGVGVIKNDRMDWLIQKATELGVTGISPLLSDYTDVKLPADRHPKKVRHWRQIIENACQQSGRTHLPPIHAPRPLTDWVTRIEADYKCVLHPGTAKPFDARLTANPVALLVGPEGGLSAAEVALAGNNGFVPITLGPRILRVETAVLGALSILQYCYGDLRQS